MVFDMEEFVIFESHPSIVDILHLDTPIVIVWTFVIGSFSLIEMFIRVLFIYYVRYKAPKNRPINEMIFFDQVIKMNVKCYFL